MKGMDFPPLPLDAFFPLVVALVFGVGFVFAWRRSRSSPAGVRTMAKVLVVLAIILGSAMVLMNWSLASNAMAFRAIEPGNVQGLEVRRVGGDAPRPGALVLVVRDAGTIRAGLDRLATARSRSWRGGRGTRRREEYHVRFLLRRESDSTFNLKVVRGRDSLGDFVHVHPYLGDGSAQWYAGGPYKAPEFVAWLIGQVNSRRPDSAPDGLPR